jgi:hypothetical protein
MMLIGGVVLVILLVVGWLMFGLSAGGVIPAPATPAPATPAVVTPAVVTPPPPPVTAPVPSGMINCKVIKLARADGKNEIINITGIDVYDQSGARITSGITPTIEARYQYGDPAQFGPQFLIDGVHTEQAGGKWRLPHTNPDANAYMQLDLGKDTIVSKIVIWNRNDSRASERIIGCKLTATNAAGTEVFNSSITTNRPSYTWLTPGTSTTSTYAIEPYTAW